MLKLAHLLFDDFHPQSLGQRTEDGVLYPAPPSRSVLQPVAGHIVRICMDSAGAFACVCLLIAACEMCLALLCYLIIAYSLLSVSILAAGRRARVHSVARRLSKVWSEERRRLSGMRRKTKKATPKHAATTDDADNEAYQADIQALNDEVKAMESSPPSTDDKAYTLIERTWQQRHSIVRSDKAEVNGSLSAYCNTFPYMTCWRMVRSRFICFVCSIHAWFICVYVSFGCVIIL